MDYIQLGWLVLWVLTAENYAEDPNPDAYCERTWDGTLVDALKLDPFVVTLIENCVYHEELLEKMPVVKDMAGSSFEDCVKRQ